MDSSSIFFSDNHIERPRIFCKTSSYSTLHWLYQQTKASLNKYTYFCPVNWLNERNHLIKKKKRKKKITNMKNRKEEEKEEKKKTSLDHHNDRCY